MFEFGSLVAESDGQALTLAAHGPAGSFYANLLSFPTQPGVTPFGLTWLRPDDFLFVNSGVLPTGRLDVTSVPHVALPSGLLVAMPMVHTRATGLSLSTPALVVLP